MSEKRANGCPDTRIRPEECRKDRNREKDRNVPLWPLRFWRALLSTLSGVFFRLDDNPAAAVVFIPADRKMAFFVLIESGFNVQYIFNVIRVKSP